MKFTKLFTTPEQTTQFGTIIGRNLKGGECIEFSSDLGGGKTTMTAGIVAGAGSKDIVSSPTFTIQKQYHSPLIQFFHFDFYRLQEPGLIAEELKEALESKNSVVIVEWAQEVTSVLPDSRVNIVINRVTDDADSRTITVECQESLDYIFKGVKV